MNRRWPRTVLRHARLVVAAIALGAGLLAVPGVLPGAPPPDPAPSVVVARAASAPSTVPAPTAGAAPTAGPAPTVAPAPTAASTPTTAPGRAVDPEPPPVPTPDAVAGVLSDAVPPVGTGETVVVPGSAPAPGPGRVRTVRVEVEGGLPVDGTAFAGFVMETLNDPRGWGHDGSTSFARVDGAAEITVVLASPETSARMCRPLDTGGTLSCRNGPRAILTHHRWVLAHPDYGDDRTGYRHYVVNHEVGHFLGHGHVSCPGPGVPAPVMMQQTKGLLGCAPNPWPATGR